MLLDMYELSRDQFPTRLLEIPQPPERLYARGYVDFVDQSELKPKKILTIVGPRKPTSYGVDCVRALIYSLRGLPVIIVSGLAYGIDSVAHEAAIGVGLPTIAFPGSGLAESAIYPRRHFNLAEKILNSPAGGMLISEFEPELSGAPYVFLKRNRLMAGIAHAVLVPEAGEKSGTLITARLAVEYNRDLLIVPGNITSPMSSGSNKLLKLGAEPILDQDSLREALGLAQAEDEPDTGFLGFSHSDPQITSLSKEERYILKCLLSPCSRDDMAEQLDISAGDLAITLALLEIKGLIVEEYGIFRRVK